MLPSKTLPAATLALLTFFVSSTDGFSHPGPLHDVSPPVARPNNGHYSFRSSNDAPSFIPRTASASAKTLFQSATNSAIIDDGTNTSASPSLHDVVVCGGGPAGLLSAIMLAQTFNYKVKVYERLPEPPSPTDKSIWSDIAKFYLIGLGERGQAALREFGVWDDVEACCTSVPGRMDWAPDAGPDEGVERIFTDRPVMTQVLPRDKLVGVLYQHILKNYNDQISIEYKKEVTPIDFDADSLEMVATKLLVAADGTQRNIANEMVKVDKEKRKSMGLFERLRYGPSFHVKRYVDDNQRVYKTIPIQVPSKWRNDLNYSARSKDGRVLFDALPADAGGNQCAVLLLKRDDELAQENSDPKKLQQLFDEVLPQFSPLLDDDMIENVAAKAPSFLPSFRYVAPRLNQGDRTIILGDAIHTVKPYFGLGANSALEDVQILKQSIESSNTMKEATHLFSRNRAYESKALVEISRDLDRPGLLGVFTFIIPLVVDSIFNKLAPSIFSPNTIAMLQKSENTFRGLRRRKRLERVGQLATLGTFFTALTMSAKQLIRALSRVTGKRNTTVTATLIAGMAIIAFAKKAAVFLVPGLAPADVLTKASQNGKGKDEGSQSHNVQLKHMMGKPI
ncbi:hypothetical protein ACHAXR_004973 [Thalassiosira sp. AJA248-18]